VLSSLSFECSRFSSSADLWTSARDWALARDAKEVLCWSYLVEAQHALARSAGPERAKHTSPGQRPGSPEDNDAKALKGRNKSTGDPLSRPFRAADDEHDTVSQGDALGWYVADPAGLKSARTALASGLKIARDCGSGLFHIDLHSERERCNHRFNFATSLHQLHPRFRQPRQARPRTVRSAAW